jgi:hypothetical protein
MSTKNLSLENLVHLNQDFINTFEGFLSMASEAILRDMTLVQVWFYSEILTRLSCGGQQWKKNHRTDMRSTKKSLGYLRLGCLSWPAVIIKNDTSLSDSNLILVQNIYDNGLILHLQILSILQLFWRFYH